MRNRQVTKDKADKKINTLATTVDNAMFEALDAYIVGLPYPTSTSVLLRQLVEKHLKEVGLLKEEK